MALSEFPKTLYKRLLRASTVIDSTHSQVAFQSILCGKPSKLYSYELKKNIEIGTASYSIYDQLVSIMNDGEYSTPTHTYPISFYSIIRNTARLCTKNIKTNHDKATKFSIFSNYCKDIILTKSELIEIVTNFESLANIAVKIKESQQKTSADALDANSRKNTFQCDVVDWTKQSTDNDLQQQIINILTNKQINIADKDLITINNDKTTEKTKQLKKKKAEPVLEYIPKTMQSTIDNSAIWRNCLLFQHPLATMSRYNNDGSIDNVYPYSFNGFSKIEPQILLGIFAQTTHPKLRLTGKMQDSCRIALIMNGERTLMNLEDVLYSEQIGDDKIVRKTISTFHGIQTVPDIFMQNNLFIGGDDLSSIEILTNNPYCKGIGIMNNKMFWNPDLEIAERIMQSGYGTVDQFRFFKGKMKWNNNLWNNIKERNLYGLISTANNQSLSWTHLAKQIWAFHTNNNHNEHEENNNNYSLWHQLLQHCCKTDTKDIESWIHLFNLINKNNCKVQQEIQKLINIHDAKIEQQVKYWKTEQLARS